MPNVQGPCLTQNCTRKSSLLGGERRTYCSVCRALAWERNRLAEGLDPAEERRKSLKRRGAGKVRPAEATCKTCGEVKPGEDFHSRPENPAILTSRCKICYNAHYRAKRKAEWPVADRKEIWGVSREDILAVFEKQGRACAICETTDFGERNPSVDHCHATLEFRGVLCHPCNTALGLLRDSVHIMERGIGYLVQSRAAPMGIKARARAPARKVK